MKPSSPRLTSAKRCGLWTCHTCGLIVKAAPRAHALDCPRCGATIHPRKPDSIQRTWALLIASAVLFIPANTLPVMETGSLFGAKRDTILSGVVYLWHGGSWMLALIVFVASILVPLSKLLALMLLVLSVQRRSRWLPLERTRLYRLLEFVGRWSMLDIYVVTLLTALVQMQSVARIIPGPGAIAFGGVVVLTMLAAMAFDPRLIWDPLEDSKNQTDD